MNCVGKNLKHGACFEACGLLTNQAEWKDVNGVPVLVRYKDFKCRIP